MDQVLASLEKLAWYEHSRGHTCCAQQAWKLHAELAEAVDALGKMEGTEGVICA